MHSAFNLGDPLDAMWALTRRELVAMLAHDKLNDALDAIYTKFEQNKRRHDLWLIEGTHEGVPAGCDAVPYHLFLSMGLTYASATMICPRMSHGPITRVEVFKRCHT